MVARIRIAERGGCRGENCRLILLRGIFFTLALFMLAILVLPPFFSLKTPIIPTSYVENVMEAYRSRITREAWEKREGAPPAPIFFLTAAKSWGKSSPEVEAVREEFLLDCS